MHAFGCIRYIGPNMSNVVRWLLYKERLRCLRLYACFGKGFVPSLEPMECRQDFDLRNFFLLDILSSLNADNYWQKCFLSNVNNLNFWARVISNSASIYQSHASLTGSLQMRKFLPLAGETRRKENC